MAPPAPTQPTNPRRTIRGHRGSLSVFLEAPVDIFIEVLSHLQPLDLLHIARTNKGFRNLLMDRNSSKSMWKSARMNFPGLPEPFPQMSEPRFASLCFETACDVCMKTGSRDPIWRLCTRLCNSCRRAETVSNTCLTVENTNGDMITIPHVAGGIPNVAGNRVLKSDAERLLAEWTSLETTEQRDEFLDNQRKHSEEIRMHAQALWEWSNARRRGREDELEDIRSERYQMIADRLVALGYKQEVDFYAYELRRSTLVRQNRPLTERAWSNIQPALIDLLENTVRPARIEHVYQTNMHERFDLLRCATEPLARQYLNVFPRVGYLARMPQIIEILAFPKDCENPGPLPANALIFISFHREQIVKTWYDNLARTAHFQLHQSIEQIPLDVEISDLAITRVVICKRCQKPAIGMTFTMATHKCGWVHDLSEFGYGCVPLEGIIENILKISGCNKFSTVETMDLRDPKLVCKTGACAEYADRGVRVVFNWREAALHCEQEHRRGELAISMQEQFGSWDVLPPNEASKIHPLQRNARVHYLEEQIRKPLWLCTGCTEPQASWDEANEHFWRVHRPHSFFDGQKTCFPDPNKCQRITPPVYLISDETDIEDLDLDVREAFDRNEAAFDSSESVIPTRAISQVVYNRFPWPKYL